MEVNTGLDRRVRDGKRERRGEERRGEERRGEGGEGGAGKRWRLRGERMGKRGGTSAG